MMRKILCILLIVAMVIGIAPSLVFAMGEQSLFIHMDDEGYVTFEPNFIDHELVLDSDFIRIRLPMEIDAQTITLSLPEGWVYEIDYEEETFPESLFAPTMEPEGKIYTIITVQHNWSSLIEEPRQKSIMPLASPILDGFSTATLPSRANLFQWNTAFSGTGNRVIIVQGDQLNMPNTINISAGRHIIIVSEGTNLENNTREGSPFTIGPPSSGRHFNLDPGATLTLVQIVLNGGTSPNDSVIRGGVFLTGWRPLMPEQNPAYLNMLTGSEIRNCRAELGGGILADYFSEVVIDGGILRENVAISERLGGGGGVRAIWGSKITLHNALIVDNKAIADYGHGGGIDVTNGSHLSINEGTIIQRNHAGRRGGGVSIWHNSTGVMNGGQIIDNYAYESGGGVVLTGVNQVGAPADTSSFTMIDGIIKENRTVERGGGISGIHPDDIYLSNQIGEQKITISGGKIMDNTSKNGGGIWFHSGTFHTTGGEITDNKAVNGAGVYWAEERGVWTTAEGEIDIRENKASGNGGGLATIGPHNRTIPARVNIQGNLAQNGGGVWMGGSGILTMNNETIPIQENQATGNGGGVYISTGTFVQSGSSITKNDATGDGGGVYVVHGSDFNGTGGSIIDNIAYDGGGLFVPHTNLDNVTIASSFVFDQNFARNGLRIDSDLAERRRATINPDTVTLLGEFIIDEVLEGTGNFKDVDPHAFTNYDINSDKPIFWRVTYDRVGGEGEVLAFTKSNEHPIKNGALLRGGTAIIFEADPIEQFERWTIETRAEETTASGENVEFTLTGEDTISPMRHILDAHTHVVGYFRTQPITTTLTVSKEVRGDFANRMIEFDFTVVLQDSTGNPQSTHEPLFYTISNSDGVILKTGEISLNSEGHAVFRLSHGQRIQIMEVPLEGSVQIIEKPDDHYQAWFTDSEFAEKKEKRHDTGLRSMTKERSFHFENVRFEVPTTGLDLGSTGELLLLFTLVSIPVFATLVIRIGQGRHKKLYQ